MALAEIIEFKIKVLVFTAETPRKIVAMAGIAIINIIAARAG